MLRAGFPVLLTVKFKILPVTHKVLHHRLSLTSLLSSSVVLNSVPAESLYSSHSVLLSVPQTHRCTPASGPLDLLYTPSDECFPASLFKTVILSKSHLI